MAEHKGPMIAESQRQYGKLWNSEQRKQQVIIVGRRSPPQRESMTFQAIIIEKRSRPQEDHRKLSSSLESHYSMGEGIWTSDFIEALKASHFNLDDTTTSYLTPQYLACIDQEHTTSKASGTQIRQNLLEQDIRMSLNGEQEPEELLHGNDEY